MKRPMKRSGMTIAYAFTAAQKISQDRSASPDAPNCKCNKCGGPLRATPSILAAVRDGFVDHKGCGGTFEVLPS